MSAIEPEVNHGARPSRQRASIEAGSSLLADRAPSGFTLIELLVVIALLALWMVLLAPALAGNKNQATGARCLINQRHLINAWRMYATDHAEKVVGNFGLTETIIALQQQTYGTWVHNTISWSSDSSSTNEALLRVGSFNRYLNGDITAYRCPCDQYLSAVQRSLHWQARARSVSMNAFFGPYNSTWTSERNNYFNSFRQFLKLDSVPKPAALYVFADEHPDSINDGYLLDDANPATLVQWGDLPASYHNGGAGFSFADGHAEIHQWASSATKLLVTASGGGFRTIAFSTENGGTIDRDWITSHTSVRY